MQAQLHTTFIFFYFFLFSLFLQLISLLCLHSQAVTTPHSADNNMLQCSSHLHQWGFVFLSFIDTWGI